RAGETIVLQVLERGLDVLVGATDTRHFGRVVNVHVGPAQLVALRQVEPQADQAVGLNPVLGTHTVAAADQRPRQRRLLGRAAGAPAVGKADAGQQAEAAVADVAAIAGAAGGAEVCRDVVVALEDQGVFVLEHAGADQRSAVV